MSTPQHTLKTAVRGAVERVAQQWTELFRRVSGSLEGQIAEHSTPVSELVSINEALRDVQKRLPWALEEDIRYYFYRNLIHDFLYADYGMASDALIAFCNTCNHVIDHPERRTRPSRRDRRLDPTELYHPLRISIESSTEKWASLRPIEDIVVGFILLCESVGTISRPHWTGDAKTIVLNSLHVDFEYLRSCLFGLWSAVSGLNNLFGGGGPYFFNHDSGEAGRVFVIEGGIGQGKSTLALSLASDVVRKGGFAWVMPFEQTCEECWRTIKDHNLIPREYEAPIRVGAEGTFETTSSADDQSCLLLVRGTKESFASVFDDVFRISATIDFSLPKCVVIDPLNAIFDDKENLYSAASGDLNEFRGHAARNDHAKLRNHLLSLIETARERGINVILVAETGTRDGAERVEIVEKLADVVVQLSRSEPSTGYTQRFLEVVKSRKQREQRGMHPYSIASGRGVKIYPSSAAVTARIRNRQTQSALPIRYGWHPVDSLLGKKALFRGDIIVFRGPIGTLKTELSAVFCLSQTVTKGTSERRSAAIFVPLKDSVSAVKSMLDRRPAFFQPGKGDSAVRSDDQITVLDVPSGYITPGVFFRQLEKSIESMRAQKLDVDRIVFDNIEHWDMNCPFIAKDPTFASTLMEFTRRLNITCLFVCHMASETTSVGAVEQSIIAAADVALDFWRYDFAGHQRVAFRIVTSRSMEHDSDYYDLAMIDGKLEVGVRAKQLRFDHRGRASAVPIILYFHEEGKLQHEYNDEVTISLKPVLTRDVNLQSADRTHLTRWLGLSAYSSVDYLQILQLDEFQVPHSQDALNEAPKDFHELKFDVRNTESLNVLKQELAPNLLQRVAIDDANNASRYFALPYYQNLGLLVFNKAKAKSLGLQCVDDKDEASQAEHGITANSEAENSIRLSDWGSIIKAYEKWLGPDPDNPRNEGLFFDFSCDKNETYICLFFEIALASGMPKLHPGQALANWFEHNQIDAKRCLKQYALIANQAHRAHPNKAAMGVVSQGKKRKGRLDDGTAPDLVSKEYPVIWRHWFTTACDMFDGIDPASWSSLHVSLLPGKISVAGEWYLTLPKSSAAPEFGTEIIKHMLDKDEEFERFRRGVGLPVRASFYEANPTGLNQLRCRYFSLPAKEVGEALGSALRRSDIREYRSVSRIFVFYLKQLLELDKIWNSEEQDQFDSLFRNMLEDLRHYGSKRI